MRQGLLSGLFATCIAFLDGNYWVFRGSRAWPGCILRTSRSIQCVTSLLHGLVEECSEMGVEVFRRPRLPFAVRSEDMGYGSMKSYLFVSDFDQTLTFND